MAISDFPLLRSQYAVYCQWQSNPGSTQYNLPFLYEFEPGLTPARLVESLKATIAIHPGLTIQMRLDDEGEIRQYYGELPAIEMIRCNESEINSLKEQLVTPFELLGQSLVRMVVIETEEKLRLFFDVHHIICDHTSYALFHQTLGTIFEGEVPVPESLSLEEAVRLETQRRSPNQLQSDFDWYETMLAGRSTTALVHRPETVKSKLITTTRRVDAGSVDNLCNHCKTTQNSLFSLILSLCLTRYTRELDCVFAVVNHGRWTKELAKTFGMFVRSAPVALQIDPEEKIAEMLRANRSHFRELWKRQAVSSDELSERFGLTFEVSFTFNGEYNDQCAHVKQVERLPVADPIRPLSIQIDSKGDYYEIRTEYDQACFRTGEMESFADSYRTCLTSVLENPDRKSGELEIVSSSMLAELLELGRGPRQEYDTSETFLDVFRRHVEDNPDKLAIVAENGSLTYRELDERSTFLAKRLMKLGAGRGSFVCIMLPRIKEYMVATLAVFKSGAAYVPLDPDYPNDRLTYMLQDSQSTILVTTPSLYDEKRTNGDFGVEHVVFPDFDESPTSHSEDSDSQCEQEPAPPFPDDAAYMIYTSGSTGRPKGVVIRHCSLLAYLAGWKGTVHEIKPDDRICCAFSFSFDASVSNLYGSLYSDATLYIVSSRTRMDLPELDRFIRVNGITAAKFPTQLGMELFTQYSPPLRWSIFGGEAMKPVRRSQTQLVNGYGPTEFTVNATFHAVDPDKDTELIPIGRPVPNAVAYITDAFGRLLPRGAVGELNFAGRQIAREYWRRPDLTAEKFIVNPWSTCDEERLMYRTGDLARWNDDGDLECLGRIDQQVKLRGFRIEPGEIENVILRYPSIRSCVVAVRELGTSQHLCAWYVADEVVDTNELRRFIGEKLTDYMVPSVWTLMTQMPMTPNGKIDHKALPQPQFSDDDLVMPQNARQQKLFDVAADILGTKTFGVTTNLMSVGMTSMSAIRMATLIQKNLRLPITTRDIFQHPTIVALTQLTDGEVLEHPPYAMRTTYPLAANQVGLYVEWRLDANNTQYNHPECYRFPVIDGKKLVETLVAVVNAHPILKSRIIEDDGVPSFVRNDEEQVEIESVILTEEPSFEFFRTRVRPFDLANGPLYRIVVCHAPRNTYLFVDIHHIVFDGVSADLFWSDVTSAWSGIAPEMEQFTAFDEALLEEELLDKPAHDAMETYYTSLLDGVSSTEYPSYSPATGVGRAGHQDVSLSRPAINSFCRRNGLTENAYFMTAFALLMKRFTREESVQFVTVSSGRTRREIESTVGMFVKTLPFVLRDEGTTMAQRTGFAQRQLFETLQRDLYPYSSLVSRFGLSPNIAFVWQERFGRNVTLDQSAGELIPLAPESPKYPFAIEVIPQGQWYRIGVEYDDSRYSESDVQTFLTAYVVFVSNLALPEYEEQDASSVPLVSVPESEKLLKLGDGGEIKSVHGETFLDVFDVHVRNHPTKIAVRGSDGELSYSELDKRSSALANVLDLHGISSGAFVCIMLPRETDFIVAILATFKAGAAYVPLDAEYPNERLQFMLDDCGSDILITTRTLLEQKRKSGHFDAKQIVFTDDTISEPEACRTLSKQRSDDLAYMIYTSGSTGRPKGVAIRTKSLVSYLSSWRGSRFEPQESDHFCCYPSFSFDASIDDLLGSLFYGASVYIIPEDLRRDVSLLAAKLVDESVTAGSFPAQIGSELLAHTELPFRFVRLGGEKFTPVRNGSTEVVNVYGPTEFTVCCSWHQVDFEKDRLSVPIGRPVPGSCCYVLDTKGRLLPHGVPGELCVAGNQIAVGYWNRPEQTEERFVRNPYSSRNDDGTMYRTGDLVRWNESGELEYLGRIDHQVKLRGFRIELEEIETLLNRYPSIISSAVAIKTVGASSVLCAYYTASDSVDTQAVRSFLAEHLTEYMIPNVFTALENLPLTPNGKLDRLALPAPQSVSSRPFVEPRSDVERALAEAFGHVLCLEQIGIDDVFFALGGDSIKAIRAVSRLRQLGFETTVPAILKLKTIREIASQTRSVSEAALSDDSPVTGEVPLTFVQKYFLDLNMPQPNRFNQTVSLESDFRVDEAVLHRVLAAIITHHDMLRVRLQDGVQRIAVPDSENFVSISVYDYRDDPDWMSTMETTGRNEMAKISLEDGPIMVAVLFRTPESDRVVLSVHHFVVDGVSWRILIDDFRTAYEQDVAGKTIQLPPKTTSFQAWSRAVEKYRQSDSLAEERDYWFQVQDALAIDPRKCREKGIFQYSSATVEAETSRRLLADASAAFGTEPNELLLTAVLRAYAKVFGKKRVSVLLEGHGREDIGSDLPIDRTVGWFTSAWPVVFDVNGECLRTDIRETKETLRRVPNRGIGYGILQYVGEPALRRDVMTDLSFNFLGDISEGEKSKVFRLQSNPVSWDAMEEGNRFGPDLGMVGRISQGEMSFRLAFDSTRIESEQCHQFAKAFEEECFAVQEYCLSLDHTEQTAWDVGELDWSDAEFSHMLESFASKGIEIRRIYPLSPMQEGFLFHRLSQPDSTAYILQKIYSCDYALSQEQVAVALERLGQRHEVLRTSILYRDVSQPRQAILHGRPFEVAFYDLSNEDDIKSAIDTIQLQDRQRGFDLQDDPLLRATVIRKGPTSTFLLITQHHIIVDGWCIGIITHDLERFLADAIAGRTPSTAEPAFPYPQAYETAVRRMIATDKKRALDYWRQYLAECETSAVIPPLSDELSHPCETTSVHTLGRELSQQIDAFCRSLEITPNTLFEGALGLGLQTLNRSDDVVYGKVVSGRDLPLPEVGKTVGLFINTIPVRVRTEAADTPATLLIRLQTQAASGASFDRCSLSDILRQTELGSDLIRTVFAFENYYVEENGQQEELQLEPITGKEETNYDVSFLVNRKSDSYHIVVLARGDRYSPESVERLTELFATLVKGLIKRSNEPLSTLPLLEQDAETNLLELGRGEEPGKDRDEMFPAAFERQALRIPANRAVVAEDGTLTYGELNERANLLAKELIRRGVSKGSFVCVMLPRTCDFLVATLGIFKAGGAYVPLDPDYPNERLLYMFQDSRAATLITTPEIFEQKHFSDSFEISSVVFLPLAPESDGTSAHNAEFHPVICLPEDPVYMIYTSGSTGKPKGVVIRHGALAAYLAWNRRLFKITEGQRICCHASFSFDASVDTLFGPLALGAEVHLISASLRRELTALNEYLLENQIAGGTFSTQLGMELLNATRCPLRFIFLGGEKLLPVRTCETMIVNGYGPTEFTVCSHYHVVNQKLDTKEIPIGRPVPGSCCYVLDTKGRLLPRGVPGELCLTGRQIAKEYWNRPDLTAERFPANPYASNPDETKYYRTGDLVRWNDSGELEFLGRIDNQIKLRGFRIELGEIESVLLRFPEIEAVIVDVRELGQSQHLCAWFVAANELNEAEIEAWLSDKLTNYMIPTIYVQLQSFPLTPNGKVDRKALTIPTAAWNEETIAPRNDLENILFEVAKKILKHEAFGVTTNLFSVGMTSMSGIRFAAALQDERLGIATHGNRITYADIFKYQTIANLAKIVTGDSEANTSQDQLENVAQFDYGKIDSMLANNSLSNIPSSDGLRSERYGDILLTGATGFLGIHVLHEFLSRYSGNVYCLTRRAKQYATPQRLLQFLFYYFDRSYAEELGKRIIVLEGDITDSPGMMKFDLPVSHIINCAANVKHFSEGNDIHETNFRGVENLIRLSAANNAKLIHVSTVSVGGATPSDTQLANRRLHENELYIGQNLDNKYIHSKFLAERAILSAVAQGSISAKIMRAGNLMPRTSDGVFQMNALSNSFAKRLKAYKLLGVFPISRLAAPIELSPVDETARALLTLGETPDRYTLFHLYNNHSISMGDVIHAMDNYGFAIRPVNDAEFAAKLNDAMKDEKNVVNFSGIIAYQRDRAASLTVPIPTDSSFTTAIQYCLTNEWGLLTPAYLTNMIDQLNGLGFFDQQSWT